MVEKPDCGAVYDGLTQRLELGKFAGLRRCACDEADPLTQETDLDTEPVGKDSENLATGGLCGGAVAGIEALRHDIAAEEQHHGFVGAEAERRQEVAFHEGVATPWYRDDWDTGFAEGFDVAIDGARADLEGGGEILGALSSFAL